MTTANGTVPTKTQIIKDVIEAMGLDLSGIYDADKVIAAAQSRYEAAGGEGDINSANVFNVISKLRASRGISAPRAAVTMKNNVNQSKNKERKQPEPAKAPDRTRYIRDVLDDMSKKPSEVNVTDYDKIIEAVNAKIRQDWNGSTASKYRLVRDNFHSLMRNLRQQEAKGIKILRVTAPKTEVAPPIMAFTHDELILARKLLSLSGDSLLRAKGALAVVADLTLVKE